eukprot:861065-Lingulodinium_polyedra.AAC.1
MEDAPKDEPNAIEDARAKARKMVANVGGVSGKVLLTVNRVKRGELSEAFFASLKAQRKVLEALRSK